MAGREPTVTDEEILEVFRASSDPVLSTSEVAEKIDLGRRGTYYRLASLAEESHLLTKKVGDSTAIWWLSSDQT